MSTAGDVDSNPFGVDLDEHALDELYRWLDAIPLSRPRKLLHRDFSDGILVAELIAHFLPRYVDLHQYMPASSSQLKRYNWQTLNKMVLTYLDATLNRRQIDTLVSATPGAIESFLHLLRIKIELAISERRFRPRRGRRESRMTSCGSNTSLNQSESETEAECSMATPRRSRRYINSLQRLGVSAVPITVSDNSLRTLNTNGGDAAVDHMLATNGQPAPGLNMVQSINSDGSSTFRARGFMGTTTMTAGNASRMYQDLVPGRLLHQAQCEIYAKDEQITALQARVRHLQRLTSLKDERIAQLTQRLDRLATALNERIQAAEPPPDTETQKVSAAQNLLNQLMDLRSSLTPSTNASDGDD